MSSSTGTVIFEDATLQAEELVANTVTLNNFSVSSTTSLQQATNVSNVTTNTVRFTNPTTAFVTTGNVEVGTANLFVDTTTGRVGVGTGSPGTLLELSKSTGSATISPTELRLSTTTNAADWNVTDPWARLSFYTDDVTGDAPGVMASVGAVASSVDGGENTRLAFFTAEPHLERMCIDRYGNVGIGTTNPSATLDVNGYIKNTNPVFSAYRSGSTTFNTANGTVVFDTKTEDSTNSYNNTNGRFTAPIAGYYMFSVYAMHVQGDYLWLSFYKNGAIVNLSNPYGNGTELVNVSGTTTMYLSQGDYVYVVLRGGSFFANNNCHNGFCGHFLG